MSVLPRTGSTTVLMVVPFLFLAIRGCVGRFLIRVIFGGGHGGLPLFGGLSQFFMLRGFIFSQMTFLVLLPGTARAGIVSTGSLEAFGVI